VANVLVLIPIRPGLAPALLERATRCVAALSEREDAIGEHQIDVLVRVCAEGGDKQPFSAHAAARNRMLDLYLRPQYTHVLWIDADVVAYPADLVTRLHAIDQCAIVAPFVLIEGGARFYDTYAFVDAEGRRAEVGGDELAGGDLIPMSSVGTCYLAPAALYQDGARYAATEEHTEHWSICQAARARGIAVWATRRIVVYHAKLPAYGEAWHVA